MNERGGIRAVTFDVGGTLIEPWPSVGQVYATVAAEFGIPDLNPDSLTRGFVQAWKGRQNFDYARASWRELVDQSFSGLTSQRPDEACFNAIYERFARTSAWRVFDDVEPTLRTLRARGFKLAVISNWDERLRPLLRLLELDQFFAVLTISCDVGCIKPAPEIFKSCAAQLDLPPEAIMHIGDSRREDMEGARTAGLEGLLLDRSAAATREGIVRSLGDLLKLV